MRASALTLANFARIRLLDAVVSKNKPRKLAQWLLNDAAGEDDDGDRKVLAIENGSEENVADENESGAGDENAEREGDLQKGNELKEKKGKVQQKKPQKQQSEQKKPRKQQHEKKAEKENEVMKDKGKQSKRKRNAIEESVAASAKRARTGLICSVVFLA
jgi:hypothetical protein